MAEDDDRAEETGGEDTTQNQYGGDSGDIDPVEQTERVEEDEDEDETGES